MGNAEHRSALMDQIAWCQRERDQAADFLCDLETSGLRTWLQKPGEDMVETTPSQVKFLRNIVAAMDRLIAGFQIDIAGSD